MRRKIIFRADASANIGCGHFVRSLALADMLKDDFDCLMVTSSASDFQIAAVRGICPLQSLPDDESRFDLFAEGLNGDEIVVLDNYWYEDDYMARLQGRGCKVVLLDDFFDRRTCADYTIFPTADSSRALLRRPFYDKARTSRIEKHIVISMGASDKLNLTYKVASYVRERFPDWKITALVGDTYLHADSLASICDLRKGLGAQEVASLFDSATLVVCSASSVCYEALSRGCAVAAGWYVDNQKQFYQRLCAEGLIYPLGKFHEGNPDFNPSDIHPPLIMPDFASAWEYYKRLFHALSMDVLPYQDLSAEQSRKVWQVRNKTEIRQWMTNPAEFSFESHCRFVESLACAKDRMYFAFFDGRQFLGSYNLVNIILGESAERGLFVNPQYQGHHVASMMELIMEYKAKYMGIKYLLADVLKINQRSLSYHLSQGYQPISEDERYVHLRKQL